MIILATVVIDNSVLKISTSVGGLRSSVTDIIVFSFTVLVFTVGQYSILGFVKRHYPLHKHASIAVGKVSMLFLNRIVTVGSLCPSCIAYFSTLPNVVRWAVYSVTILRVIVFIAYGLSFALLALLAERFFSWFRFNHNSVVLAYAIATSMIAVNSLIAIIYLNIEFSDAPVLIRPKQALRSFFLGFADL